MTNVHGGTHSYKIEERTTFAKIINVMLKNDEDIAPRLPINPNDDTLFHSFDNGILLCKLMMNIDDGCIDSRALNRQ